MSSGEIIYTPPKCNRCNEKDLDCSLRHADDVDIFLPDLINNVEAHMTGDREQLDAVLKSQKAILSLGQEILREIRMISGCKCHDTGPARAFDVDNDNVGTHNNMDLAHGCDDDAEDVPGPLTHVGGGAAHDRLSPELGDDTFEVEKNSVGKARKRKQPDDADDYEPSFPQHTSKLPSREPSKRLKAKHPVITSEDSDAASKDPQSKLKKKKSATPRESSVTFSETAVAGPSQSGIAKKRSVVNVESSSSDSDDDSKKNRRKNKLKTEGEHKAQFMNFRAHRLMRPRGDNADKVVVKAEKM
uniref:Zn(2)-C6 fungal-type domain-containing protein n=1 Tax=Ganoderma boninense TaxID=34458 RepID=A0A5K1JYH5_9APHY|nr:Zn(2)-C6 fungal-type domain-containing protein [Ganoderma boninense]